MKMSILLLFLLILVLSCSDTDKGITNTNNPSTIELDSEVLTTLLGGFGQMDNYPGAYTLSSDGWKCFRFQADMTGNVNFFNIFIKDYRGNRTNDQVCVAIHADTLRSDGYHWPGHVKAYSYLPNYNWTFMGKWNYHVFPVTNIMPGKNTSVVAGRWYWLVLQTTAYDNVQIERGRANYPRCPTSRKGAQTTKVGTALNSPPQGIRYDVNFGNYNSSCYGYAIWE